MDSGERWYSIKEVAGILSVSRDSVIRWIEEKKALRAFKFPASSLKRKRKYNSYRVSESEVQRFVRVHMTS